MARSQVELLVLYQDIVLMLEEIEDEEKCMDIDAEGKEKLKKALEDVAKDIQPRYIRMYERLKTRYSHPMVPVQDDTCLGCFSKLPTSYSERGRNDEAIFTCENCGRLLYWIE